MSPTTEDVGYFHWAYSGVDNSLPGNGGESCKDFIPFHQKIIETIIFSTVSVAELCYAWPRASVRVEETWRGESAGARSSRLVLLAAMCLTFGIELGFKLASRQMIWVLNPCHVVTMMQIFLLAASPSKLVTAVFRVQMHCLTGALIAMVLPIVNTRLLPFETHVYYVQHALILVVPFFLLRNGGVYVAEAYGNFTWVVLTLGLLFVYHWLPLQLLANVSRVNLNNMLCPAISDPFHGRWYRIAAVTHQTLLISFHGKLYTFITQLLLGRRVSEGHVSRSNSSAPSSSAADQPNEDKVSVKNGYTKTK